MTTDLHTEPDWRPAADPLDPVVIIHRDATGDVYWCGYTNGHDGQGWTAERAEAMQFDSFAAASRERKVVRRMHPAMAAVLERVP